MTLEEERLEALLEQRRGNALIWTVYAVMVGVAMGYYWCWNALN